jgi:hypothetical protein
MFYTIWLFHQAHVFFYTKNLIKIFYLCFVHVCQSVCLSVSISFEAPWPY